jgi:hypothetical protein
VILPGQIRIADWGERTSRLKSNLALFEESRWDVWYVEA